MSLNYKIVFFISDNSVSLSMNNGMDHYRLLQEHLDKLPIGFPKTESGVEIKILQHLFDAFEARVALCLSLGNASVPTVQKRMIRKFNEACELDEDPVVAVYFEEFLIQ